MQEMSATMLSMHTRGAGVQVKSPGDMRNFDVEKMKSPEDSGYKSTGLFADF